MEPVYYASGLGGLVALVLVVLLVRQRGARQRIEAGASGLGMSVRVKSSVEPEMQGIKAGRDVKAIAGPGDAARMADVDAGRDVIRDTTGNAPKVQRKS